MKDIEGKTLTQLEGFDWGTPAADGYPPPDSYLTQACYGLRHKPLRDFTVEDLRILIGQNIGLPYLLPKAVKVLHDDPFAEGMHYMGDLLCSVLRADTEFYRANPKLKQEVREIVDLGWSVLHVLGESNSLFVKREVGRALARFEAQG